MKRQLFAASALLFALLAATALPAAPFSNTASAETAWHREGAVAFAEARRSDKLVLVELYADWCGWCKVMERETFSSAQFAEYAKRFVLLRVDVDDRGEGMELQRRFRATSLPTLLILDAFQAKVGDIQGYHEPHELLPLLDRALARHAQFLADFDRALAGADPAVWLASAKEMHQRGDGKRAARAFEKVLQAKTISGDALAWAKLQLADAYRMSERFDLARKTAAALKAELRAAPAGDTGNAQSKMVAERVDLLLLYIAGAEHDCGDAASALAAFEKGYPKSPFLADARKAYRATTSDSGTQCS